MVARVRVTSDEASHVNCVSVASKKCYELRVVFTNATDGESESDMGSLVTEIDLAHASQITEILAMGGGDVTVLGGVLISDIDHGVMLIALHETKLSIDERQREHFQVKDLLIGSASSGEIFISANDLTVLSTFATGVLGNGRVHVVAECAWAKTTQQSLVGEYGTIQMQTSHGLATSELSVAVLGSGYATIQSSSAVEIDEHTTCAKMDLRVEGSGRIDVAGVPSARTRVKIRENGRVVVQPRLKLELDCSDDGVVECIGSLPPSVQTSSEFRADAIVLTSHHDRMVQQRVVRATAPVAQIPATPTVERAFDTAQWLHVVKAGFRDTFLRPFFQSL